MLSQGVHKVEQIGLIGEVNHFISLLGRQFHSSTQSVVPGILLIGTIVVVVGSGGHR